MTESRPTLENRSLIWAFTRASILGGLLLCGLTVGAWYFARAILVQQEQLQASKVPQLQLAYQLSAATADLQALSILVPEAESLDELKERQNAVERASEEIRLVFGQLLTDPSSRVSAQGDLVDRFHTIVASMFSYRKREIQITQTVADIASSVDVLLTEAQKDIRNTIVDLTDMMLADSRRQGQPVKDTVASNTGVSLSDTAWSVDSEKKALLIQVLELINQELISLQALASRVPLITDPTELGITEQRYSLLVKQLLTRVVYLEDSELKARLLDHISSIRNMQSAEENHWKSQLELLEVRANASEVRQQLADNTQLILQQTDKLTDSASESLALAAEQSRKSMGNYLWYLVLGALLGLLVLGSFFYRLMYLELVRPLARLTARLKRAGSGDGLAQSEQYRFSELADLSLAVSQLDQAQITLQQQSGALASNNAELKRLNTDLEQFAYVASHDLQEPLRKLQQFSAVLREDYEEELSGDGAMYLDVISDSAYRMRQLISDTLEYSKAGLPQQKLEVVDVVNELKEIQQELKLLIVQSGARISISALPKLYGSATGIRQLFRNLITNAIKYSRKDTSPVIQIRSESDEQTGEFLIHVQDNGLGVSAQFQERIFMPFERLVDKGVAGTGLGLAICRKVCTAHGWVIDIQSDESSGSCFTIRGPRSSIACLPAFGDSQGDT